MIKKLAGILEKNDDINKATSLLIVIPSSFLCHSPLMLSAILACCLLKLDSIVFI